MKGLSLNLLLSLLAVLFAPSLGSTFAKSTYELRSHGGYETETSPVLADEGTEFRSEVAQEAEILAEESVREDLVRKPISIQALKPGAQALPSLAPSRTDYVTAFTRALTTGVGLYFSVRLGSENLSPAVAMAIAAAGGLTTGGFQALYKFQTLWQTHSIEWKLNGMIPSPVGIKKPLGPLSLLGKEYVLQLFFYSVLRLTSLACGNHESVSAPLIDAFHGLASDGFGNIVISTSVAYLARTIEKAIHAEPRRDIKNWLRKKVGLVWIGGAIATSFCALVCTGLVTSHGFGYEGSDVYLSAVEKFFGMAYGGILLAHISELQNELDNGVKAVRLGIQRVCSGFLKILAPSKV